MSHPRSCAGNRIGIPACHYLGIPSSGLPRKCALLTNNRHRRHPLAPQHHHLPVRRRHRPTVSRRRPTVSRHPHRRRPRPCPLLLSHLPRRLRTPPANRDLRTHMIDNAAQWFQPPCMINPTKGQKGDGNNFSVAFLYSRVRLGLVLRNRRR